MLNLYPTGAYLGQVRLCLIMRLRDYLLRMDKQKSSIPTASPQRNRRPKLHEKMLKSIHDIYSRDETFLDFLAHDLEDDSVWFNNSEFARFHDINGKKKLSIFTANMRDKTLNVKINDETPEGITKSGGVLFCRVHDFPNWNAGGSVKIDGKRYTISEARLIQDQVWRVVLEANNG